MSGESGIISPGGGVLPAAAARRRGLDARGLRHAVAGGQLVRVSRGAYVDAQSWAGADARGRHLLRMAAAATRLDLPVFSHHSAAAAHRLPVLGSWPEKVHVTAPCATGGRSQLDVVRHCTADVVATADVAGLVVTNLARTVVDLARTQSMSCGLVAADAALHSGAVVLADLLAEADQVHSPRGARRMRRVLAHASPHAESPGESFGRARFLELGVAQPELQHEVVVGRRRYRVDYWWPQLGLVGEFDGRLKYLVDGLADDRRALEDRVWAEKRREDDLRAAGLRVIRFVWADWLDESTLVPKLVAVGLLPSRRSAGAVLGYAAR
ncbi:MAG: type IV toxin-antitoxin system AbiEi family antitoxin domain-containing protein [Actinobacteria bacterium]|nr:type IV toxin-antitoxin system AbiEi family antitoxin domain-containing protein [Actinomycetota bacterium]MCG2799208.1 type IV toxin-antitoxin system AbiEi family antitoxin domain-containing protein [Cellulomonas sp.]